MHRAREKESKRDVFRHHIRPDGPPHRFTGSLICWKCAAPFVAVRAHTNKGADVQAQFRLAAKKEHDGDCPLNPTLVSRHIAHGSHGLAEVDEQGILRLNLPQHLTDVPSTTPDDDVIGEDVLRHSVTTVRPLLPPAVNSAAKIAALLQIHDFDSKIVERFKVRPHGERLIPWGRFCYGPAADSYAELYQRCRTGAEFTHPIAVIGTVQRVSRDRQGRPFITLALNVPAGNGSFDVAVRSEYAPLIEPLTAGTHVLAVGADWEVFDGGRTPQLRLWAADHWQLAFWTTDEDGQSTTPHCPPPVTALQRRAQTDARNRRARRAAQPPPAAVPPAPVRQTLTEPSLPPVTEVRGPLGGPPRLTKPAAATEGTSRDDMNRERAEDAPLTGASHEPVASVTPNIPPIPPQPPAPAGAAPPQPTQERPLPPPLPPFSQSDQDEGGRFSALGRWLRRARRT